MRITKKNYKFLVKFLKDFKVISELISGEKYVTLPGIIAVNCLLDKIENNALY